MPIDSNALNIAQWAALSNDPLVQAVTFSLIDNGSILQDVPFQNHPSMKVNGVRWTGNLPSVNWVSINQEGVVTASAPTPYSEQVFIIRNYIDTDHLLVEDVNSIGDPRGQEVDAYMKAVTYDVNDKYINNDHVTGDPNAIVGLRARLDNPTVYGARAANKINANALVVTQSATTAQANQFLEFLDQLLWSVGANDGNGVVIYTNEAMKRRMAFLARSLGTNGGFKTTEDQFGRTIEMYRGAVIRDVGYKADQATRIITVTENADGTPGSSNYTSLYAVNYSPTHMHGWQFAPLAARDLGLLNNGVIYRTMVDWAAGLVNDNDRSIARLYGLKFS